MYQRLILLCVVLFSCHQQSAVPVEEVKDSFPLVEITENRELLSTAESDGPLSTDPHVLEQKITALLLRARAGNYNTRYGIIADLGLHSGSKRMYVADLSTKKIKEAGLVTHGSSTTYLGTGKRLYSNVVGSLCSSLGMYKIGGHYQGQFGLAYKLFGLDTSNSNAYERAVVLHSFSCVPDEETTATICQSWGCPTVSPVFLQTLASYIDHSGKPMLLYIFDSTTEVKSEK